MVGHTPQHSRLRWQWVILIAVVACSFAPTAMAEGASLKMTPSTGVYEVGGLVDVSFIVDTGGQSINAVQADILFPADKLQVVNPAASTSFISIWVTAPSYSNTDGTIHFQGGLPTPGIKTSGGVISTVTFRIKAAGKATIRYAPTSRILLNDGAGTDILSSSGIADFTLKTPPPAGPIVHSPTHPDANTWYNNPQVQFQWDEVEGATGYSYSFDQSSKTIPAETANATTTATSVKASGDGVWYFHLRAKTDIWGGVTTFPVQIDATAPADFDPKFDHDTVTIEDVPTLRFLTTDAASGIDHYEVKQVAVNVPTSQVNTLFVEASSPYTLAKFPTGSYEFIVRAFDRAGNSSDGSTKLTVVASGLPFYASVPFLRNPAIANTVLITLAILALTLVTILLLRRFRLQTTFQHDLAALEHDAMKKSQALERELTELRRAQQIVNQDLGALPTSVQPLSESSFAAPVATDVASPPSVPDTSAPATNPTSPYRYQPPPPLP